MLEARHRVDKISFGNIRESVSQRVEKRRQSRMNRPTFVIRDLVVTNFLVPF